MHLNAKHKNCFVVSAQKKSDADMTDGRLDVYLNDTRLCQILGWTEKNHPRTSHVFSHRYEDHGLRLWLTPHQDEDAPDCATWVCNNTTYLGWKGKTTPNPITVTLSPDMTDMFEVRMSSLGVLDRSLEIMDMTHAFGWRYRGVDGVWRGAMIPRTANRDIQFENEVITLTIEPEAGGGDIPVFLDIRCLTPEEAANPDFWQTAYAPVPPAQSWRQLKEDFQTFENQFDLSRLDVKTHGGWIKQAIADLFVLSGEGVNGAPCIHAGVPWFCALFGRDSLITADQALPVNPTLAKNTLAILGALQGRVDDPRCDELPGKIAHEVRHNSERCFTRDVPFGRYYGGIDQTSLYLSLMANYARQTHDLGFVQSQEDEIILAVAWLEAQLRDKQFVTYQSNLALEGPHALIEKGWKDGAPVIHADQSRAPHPIALVEVQGYAYRALNDTAWMITSVLKDKDHADLAVRLIDRAHRLKDDFEKAFWMPDIGTYAMAIDGNGQQCRVISSNPGHLLRTGIVDNPERIAGIAATFANPGMLFSGWGARTLSAEDASYDPASYQLGAVWPHDTWEAVRGLMHVGELETASKLACALMDLTGKCNGRLPELVRGNQRVGDDIEIYYHSCSPQAWAASLLLSLLLNPVTPKAQNTPCPNP